MKTFLSKWQPPEFYAGPVMMYSWCVTCCRILTNRGWERLSVEDMKDILRGEADLIRSSCGRDDCLEHVASIPPSGEHRERHLQLVVNG